MQLKIFSLISAGLLVFSVFFCIVFLVSFGFFFVFFVCFKHLFSYFGLPQAAPGWSRASSFGINADYGIAKVCINGHNCEYFTGMSDYKCSDLSGSAKGDCQQIKAAGMFVLNLFLTLVF